MISSGPHFTSGSSTEPTTVKSRTPFLLCPEGDALGLFSVSSPALELGSEAARFERLPRRLERRSSKPASSVEASSELARTEIRATRLTVGVRLEMGKLKLERRETSARPAAAGSTGELTLIEIITLFGERGWVPVRVLGADKVMKLSGLKDLLRHVVAYRVVDDNMRRY